MGFCSGCGQSFQEGARFCQSCGRVLSGQSEVPAAIPSWADAGPSRQVQNEPPVRVIVVAPERAGRMAFRTFLLAMLVYVIGAVSTHGSNIGILMLLCFGCGAVYGIYRLRQWSQTTDKVVEGKAAAYIWIGLMALFGFSGLISFAALDTVHTTSSARSTVSPVAASDPSPTASDSSTKSTPKSTVDADVAAALWQYSNSTDPMSNQQRKWACVKASNLLDFDFPYSGGSTAQLCFRQRGKGLDAYLQIDKGQFMCSYDGCSSSVKFDSGPIRTFWMAESDSGSSTVLFFSSPSTLLGSVKKSKHIKVEAKFYQEGNRVMEFDVGGLDSKWFTGKS